VKDKRILNLEKRLISALASARADPNASPPRSLRERPRKIVYTGLQPKEAPKKMPSVDVRSMQGPPMASEMQALPMPLSQQEMNAGRMMQDVERRAAMRRQQEPAMARPERRVPPEEDLQSLLVRG